jgi:tight adherence protein B
MMLIYTAATFVGTFVVFLLIGMLATGGSRSAGSRLREMTAPPKPATGPQPETARRSDTMPILTRALSGRHLTEQLYIGLAAAGLPIRPSEFVGIMIGSVIFWQLIAMLIAKNILGHVLFAIVGVGLPIAVLRVMQQKRRTAFDNQIVDALMLISSSLRSGFSFLRALQMVAQEMPPPISKEFERVIQEVNVGRPMEDALRAVVARVRSYDFDLVVTAVLIQLQVGGNLADVLETIASTIRERVRIMGEMRALTAEGKMSGLVLVLLPITLGLVLVALNPPYMAVLIHEKVGHFLIGVAAVLQIVGGLVIRKQLRIDI